MTEAELDSRAEVMASMFGGWIDVGVSNGVMAYGITSWSDELDMPITIVQAWSVRN
jgi:hypothetical protein